MNDLIASIEALKSSEISEIINSRINEFSNIKNMSGNFIFRELCFCIMTANCGAEKCIEIHERIGAKFNTLTELKLTERFKEYGYRFPNIRSKFIIEARKSKDELKNKIKFELNKKNLREWIVGNIKGIGYKEASHFLRNIGFTNYAIIDFHIIDLLIAHGLIEKPKTLTRRKYLEIENILKNLADKLSLNLAELDLYLWFLETGKILK
ncbi:MAG: N-glycosylase/DNA lyase [Candidatus Odinarchaeota archaeon]